MYGHVCSKRRAVVNIQVFYMESLFRSHHGGLFPAQQVLRSHLSDRFIECLRYAYATQRICAGCGPANRPPVYFPVQNVSS